MKLSIRGMAIAAALLCGGCVFVVGIFNLASPSYGMELLKVMSSVYPGFHASRTFADVLVGTGYGIVDGAIGGFLFAWLYNLFTRRAA
ncbi:MAG: hypothetical protein JW793_14345 [Acidobacteria bacterium]|nr:hypothetical protein [Acidobacteriota bacterium]